MQLKKQSEETDKMDKLKEHIYDESNGLHYTLAGDYYILDLKLPEVNVGQYDIIILYVLCFAVSIRYTALRNIVKE